MGYSMQVYNDGSHEIDFIACKGGRQYYIQAAYSVAENKAWDRSSEPCQNGQLLSEDRDYER